MRNWILGGVAALAILLAVPQPGYAGGRGHGWHGGRGGHGHGHYRGRGYYGGYGYRGFGAGVVVGGLLGIPFGWARPWAPRYAYPPPYVYAPQVVVQEPPIYVEQPQDDEAYWYYCQGPQGYYPYVQRCGSQWMQVVPPQGPPN